MSHSSTPHYGRTSHEQPVRARHRGTQLLWAVLIAAALSVLLLPRSAAAQDQPPENPYEAPQLVAPTGGSIVSTAGALPFQWRAAQGAEGTESTRYHQFLQRLVVERTTNAGEDTTSFRLVKTYAIAPPTDRHESSTDAQSPYPTVGDWYPDTDASPPPQHADGVWEVHLPHPTAGAWFPHDKNQPALPRGAYRWKVQLLGAAPSGTTEVLASSQAASFTVAGASQAPVADDPPPADEKPSDDISAEVPDQVSITLMPRGGLFLSGVSSFEDISGEASSSLGGEQSVLTLGGSIAFGSRDGPANLRITGLRTTGSLVSTTEGTTSPTDFGRENILAFTGDLVVRPLPRLLVQPYAIGGLGARRISVQQLEELASSARWDMAAQIGIGADLRLGNVTLGVEVVDYLTGFTDSGSSLQHDAFVFLTLGVPVY